MAIVASGQLTLVDMNDSKQLVAYIGSSQSRTVIYSPQSGTYVPDYSSNNQVLTPQLFIAGSSTDIASSAKSISWSYQTNGGGTVTDITASGGGYTLGTGLKTLTISNNVLASNNSMTYICEIVYTDTDTGFDVTTKAEIELVKVTNGTNGTDGTDGVNAITGVLSNESHTIPTDSAGNNGNFTGANTTMYVYNGATDDTSNWTISATPSTGVTGSLTTGTYTVTGMTVDTGYVDLTATRSGYSSITKRFQLSKNKAGSDGTDGTNGQHATAYWMISDASAIQKDTGGNYTPSTITVSGKSQTGTGSAGAYAGRFVIADTTNGTTYTDRYTSASNESSKTYTPNAGITALRVRFYKAGGTSTLLDEQIIPVVVDGTNGTNGVNSVVATVWTPDGNTLKNSEGNLTAEVKVYDGTTEVTPTAFKWYIQDPTATTASGGDTDGGNGWRLLNAGYTAGTSNYNTAVLTIPASAIANVESFKCVATYGGNKYSDVCTVIDVTDPIVVTVVGLNTFKNGEGSTTLTAKLYRNGAEIDSGDTMGYTYTWSLYKSDGTLDATFSELGKTITVNATDVNVRANIVCEVSK